MQRKYVFLACFFLWTTAVAQQYPFVYYTPKDGLVNSRVRSIRQDSRGRMFFLTYGGLSIYDGTRFINYHKENGLANEVVNDIIEITPDSFLIATNTRGLNTMVKGRIGNLNTGGFAPVVNRFFKSSEGQLYVTADEGLYLMQGNRPERIPLISQEQVDVGKFLDRIIEWKDFLLVLAWDEGGLMLVDKKTKRLVDLHKSERIYSLTMDHEGRIWMGAAREMKWLNLGELAKGRLVTGPLSPRYRARFPRQTGTVFFDSNNNCLLHGGSQIFWIPDKGQTEVIGAEQGFKTGNVFEIFEDREGLIWIASDGNGVIKWKGKQMQMITSINSQPMAVSAIAADADTVWLYNTADKKIYRLSGNRSNSFTLPQKTFRPHAIVITGASMYLTTPDKILFVGNKNDQRAYDKGKVFSIPGRLQGAAVSGPDGSLIVHTSENFSTYFITAVKDQKKIADFPVKFTTDQLLIDREGRVWVITRGNQLVVLGPKPGNSRGYFHLLKDLTSYLAGFDPGPRSIALDSSGHVWIGTRNNGVFRLRLRGLEIDSVLQFTTREGLSDNFVYSLACDKNGTVWAGTQSGLDKIFFKNGRYIIGNTGRVNNWYQSIVRLLATPSGTVWATTSETSVMKIAPGNPRVTSYRPVLGFTSVMVNNQPSELAKAFSYKQNHFSFSVAAPSFIDERSIQYSYRLEGSANESWSVPSNISSFHFINLAPGYYTLHIRCDFPEEVYAPAYLSYSFYINPPWWQTWWFRISFALMVIGGVVTLVRFYYKRKMEKQRLALEKQQVIEKERTRIATDMHDDLGAGLSRIKFLSETIGIKKQQQLPIEEDIGKIREYAHEMIDKMGEIVWALNEKNDSLTDLLVYTRAYAVEYLSQNGIRCQLEMPGELPAVFVSGEFRRNIFLSVKEALHNIVKHAQADSVWIRIQAGKNLTIRINDNGVGIRLTEIRPFGNGLDNMKKRMQAIGGKAVFRSGSGTEISLSAPVQ